MGKNRQRFERELIKGRTYDLFAVVVEASLADVSQGRYKSEMKPYAALQSLIAFQVRYGVPFVWAGNRAGAEYYTYWLLSKYLREIGERYKLAVKSQTDERKEKPKDKKNRPGSRLREVRADLKVERNHETQVNLKING